MRENTVYIRPPRALWVPFDLGRPLGAPNDPAFQTDVLRAVLGLLERRDGPVILEDYPHDAPDQGHPDTLEGMVCPMPLPKRTARDAPDLVAVVAAEARQLAPWAELFRTTHGRSSVGVSRLALDDALRLIGDFLTIGRTDLVAERDWPTTLRFACEDLRNHYLEAATMRPGGAATQQHMVDWFWGETSAGELLLALHRACANHSDPAIRAVAIVPRVQQQRL